MAARSKSSLVPSARILLVDDNRAGLMARSTVLQELGYATDGAPDAQKALEMFRNGTYDLVVTDYKMPETNGVELIVQLRAEKPQTPVVLISGFVDALGLTEKNTGANVVIMKSANEVQHLIRAANRLLKIPRKPMAEERPALRVRTRKAGS